MYPTYGLAKARSEQILREADTRSRLAILLTQYAKQLRERRKLEFGGERQIASGLPLKSANPR